MRRLVRIGVAAGAVAATSMGPIGGASAAGTDDYYADLQGQYATIEGSVGSAFLGNLLSGQITLGELQASLNSQGVGKLNGFAAPDGTKVGARGDLANVGLSAIKIQSDHVQSTAPVSSGPAQRTYLPIALKPIINAGLIHGETMAKWDGTLTSAAPTQKVADITGDTGYLELLDLGSLLGSFESLLPPQLQHPVVAAETVRVHGELGTIRNSDGTHGLSANGIGGLASVQIFGGASNGGITLGLFNADTGGQKDTAGTRVWATGKPGKAGCDYVVPDTVQAAIGSPDNKVALSLSTGQRINIPGGLGYLDVRFTGQSHCETSADGTYAHATGAGVGLSFHLTLPTVAGLPGGDIGNFTLTLPDLDNATVKVPKGGIPPTDGPVDGGGDDDTDDGDGGGGVSGPTSGNGNGNGNGAPAAIPSVVASGVAGESGASRWVLPAGAGLAVTGGLALVAMRRRLLAMS